MAFLLLRCSFWTLCLQDVRMSLSSQGRQSTSSCIKSQALSSIELNQTTFSPKSPEVILSSPNIPPVLIGLEVPEIDANVTTPARQTNDFHLQS